MILLSQNIKSEQSNFSIAKGSSKRHNTTVLVSHIAIAIAILLVFVTSFALAAPEVIESFYADVIFDVGHDGKVAISGTTNHPDLIGSSTDGFTSKKGIVWLLNVSPEGQFSDLVYEVRLPKNAVINYLKSSSQVRIGQQAERIIISGYGEDLQLDLLVQYTIADKQMKEDFLSLIIIGAVLLIGATIFAFILFRKHSKTITHNHIDTSALTERQKLIIDQIVKNGGSITQAEIERYTGLAKSSLSRNIETLARKGIIVKEQIGMSNRLSLKRADEK